jgi:hypothetical protein
VLIGLTNDRDNFIGEGLHEKVTRNKGRVTSRRGREDVEVGAEMVVMVVMVVVKNTYFYFIN